MLLSVTFTEVLVQEAEQLGFLKDVCQSFPHHNVFAVALYALIILGTTPANYFSCTLICALHVKLLSPSCASHADSYYDRVVVNFLALQTSVVKCNNFSVRTGLLNLGFKSVTTCH